jgi:outer membrane cobalamin receptor
MVLRVLIILYFVFSSSVFSEEIPIIVISAGKTEQSKNTVGSDVAIIGVDKIEKSSNNFLMDVIKESCLQIEV